MTYGDFLLKHTDQGRNKIYFKMIVSNCEVKINSKQSFKIDSDFLDNLRNVTGVMDVNQTNKKSS